LKAELQNNQVTVQEIKKEIHIKNRKLAEMEEICEAQMETISATQKKLTEPRDQVKKLTHKKRTRIFTFANRTITKHKSTLQKHVAFF